MPNSVHRRGSCIAAALVCLVPALSVAAAGSTPAAHAAAGPASAQSPAPAPQSPAPQSPAPPSQSPTPPSPSAAPAAAEAPLSGPRVIQLLDQTVDWYRTLGIQQQAANEPSDLLILYDNRQTAGRVIAAAFEIARADADILARQPAPPADTSNASLRPLLQMQDKYSSQAVAAQAELGLNQQQLAHAGAKRAVELRAKIAELQGEMDLINARKNLLGAMITIASENGTSGFSPAALKAQIDAMAINMPTAGLAANIAPGSAVPAAPAQPAPAAAPAPPAAANASAPLAAPLTGASANTATRFGIWDLAANVFRLSEKIVTIDGLDKRTAELQDDFSQVRKPLVEQLKALSARGDALADQADTADANSLNNARNQLDALAEQFKAAAALLIPLGRQQVLLDQYRRNLGNWRTLIKNQYAAALETLGIRVGVLLVLLAIIFVVAELSKRGVTHYIRDARRRYQLLLLRRIALWSLVIIVVGFAFASELTSVVTFAGLITAGLAVAMQSVLVSIVGYFFLIGKYGIRVGDRVQIGEVTGEVIELGLVRLHLMELGAHGQMGPTGRVVAFANSIVFQVASGLFKQIPGVNFVWHELTVTLPPGVDYAATKQQLMAALTTALQDSRDEIERQAKEIQRTAASESGGDSQPRVQLSFSAGGVEAHVRYPVHMADAAETDERVSRELLHVVTGLRQAAAAQPA